MKPTWYVEECSQPFQMSEVLYLHWSTSETNNGMKMRSVKSLR